MSTFRRMAEQANVLFSRGNIDKFEFDPAMLAPGQPASSFLRELGIVNSDPELDYLRSWPDGLKEALRATIISALSRSPRVPLMFSWAPAYDYELNVWEELGTDGDPGGITILLRSRYPSDTHPKLS